MAIHVIRTHDNMSHHVRKTPCGKMTIFCFWHCCASHLRASERLPHAPELMRAFSSSTEPKISAELCFIMNFSRIMIARWCSLLEASTVPTGVSAPADPAPPPPPSKGRRPGARSA